MNNRKNTFEFTYSAERQNEIEKIRNKYMTELQAGSTLEELRKLDKSTTRAGVAVSVIIGLTGTLIMGRGMSIIMVFDKSLMWLGILLGIIGIVVALTAFPVYKAVTERQRKKNAPRIIELSDRLLHEKTEN